MPTTPRSRASGSRAIPLIAKALRPPADCGLQREAQCRPPGRLDASALSKYSKNREAAWIFMQWGCCKEIMTRCTLLGGFAPMRISSFDDPRVKAKAKVGRRHHAPSRDGEVDHRQRDRHRAAHAALGRLLDQRDPDRARQAAHRPGLWRRRQEVHGCGREA